MKEGERKGHSPRRIFCDSIIKVFSVRGFTWCAVIPSCVFPWNALWLYWLGNKGPVRSRLVNRVVLDEAIIQAWVG
jgi:hypothetical protein